MSIEKALGKLRAAQMCHPNAVQALIDEAIAAIQQAEQPATGEPVDFPAGAIVNGRTLMDRIEAYPFESEGGDLRMCSDWHELRRCFEHLADYVSPHPAPSVPDDVVRDAERGRFLVGWLKRFGLLQAELGQIGAGEKPEDWWLLHAPWGIDKTRPFFGHGKTPEQAIDAARLADKKGGAQ